MTRLSPSSVQNDREGLTAGVYTHVGSWLTVENGFYLVDENSCERDTNGE
jgi:hypothetical protein